MKLRETRRGAQKKKTKNKSKAKQSETKENSAIFCSRAQKSKSKTHLEKGKAKEKLNFTNHSRVITWKMNFFVSKLQTRSLASSSEKVAPRLPCSGHPLSPTIWQTNNLQFVRFNFCVF